MDGAGIDQTFGDTVREGKVSLRVSPTGGDKGPGSKGGVFFNPAMVQNRDLSVVLVDLLSENGLLPGKEKRVLDGLCGSGARAIRLSVETRLCSDGVRIVGTDLDPASVDSAKVNAGLNEAEVHFLRSDLNAHLIRERYSYLDIDPFGSPVPFLQNGICGTLNGGFLGVTATDTAALTGSVPRVSIRRYGAVLRMTHSYQEMACRTLMAYIARTAATFERGVEPVLFYSSDHFIRGYVRIHKGARKADRSLEHLNWIRVPDPGPPVLMPGGQGDLGPVWTGPLEDPDILNGLRGKLFDEEKWEYLESRRNLQAMIDRSITEHGLPILGYDLNSLASHLGTSPPSMEKVFSELGSLGRITSRSRFSPTIFKTDASREEVHEIFLTRGK
ncbi:MAG: hypothetical protein ACMUHM_05905 [Thermoplasmatota archaeon]